jgi:CheY-like chemotaxis protein
MRIFVILLIMLSLSTAHAQFDAGPILDRIEEKIASCTQYWSIIKSMEDKGSLSVRQRKMASQELYQTIKDVQSEYYSLFEAGTSFTDERLARMQNIKTFIGKYLLKFNWIVMKDWEILDRRIEMGDVVLTENGQKNWLKEQDEGLNAIQNDLEKIDKYLKDRTQTQETQVKKLKEFVTERRKLIYGGYVPVKERVFDINAFNGSDGTDNSMVVEDPVSGLRILIADDDKVKSSILGVMLERKNDVDIAYDIPEALSKIRTKPYDLVFMDINLGTMYAGYNLISEIREAGFIFPVISIGATDYSSYELEVMFNKGMDGHINLTDGVATIENILSGKMKVWVDKGIIPKTSKQAITPNYKNRAFDLKLFKGIPAKQDLPPKYSLKGMRTLIVDDGNEFPKIIIRQLDLDADIANNPEQALILARNNKYDLIFLDLFLAEGETGLQVAQKIRQEGYTTPIIGISSSDYVGDLKAMFESGMDGWLDPVRLNYRAIDVWVQKGIINIPKKTTSFDHNKFRGIAAEGEQVIGKTNAEISKVLVVGDMITQGDFAADVGDVLKKKYKLDVDMASASEGMKLIRQNSYDVIMIERVKDDKVLWTYSRTLREEGNKTPIICIDFDKERLNVLRGMFDQGVSGYITWQEFMEKLGPKLNVWLKYGVIEPKAEKEENRPVVDAGDIATLIVGPREETLDEPISLDETKELDKLKTKFTKILNEAKTNIPLYELQNEQNDQNIIIGKYNGLLVDAGKEILDLAGVESAVVAVNDPGETPYSVIKISTEGEHYLNRLAKFLQRFGTELVYYPESLLLLGREQPFYNEGTIFISHESIKYEGSDKITLIQEMLNVLFKSLWVRGIDSNMMGQIKSSEGAISEKYKKHAYDMQVEVSDIAPFMEGVLSSVADINRSYQRFYVRMHPEIIEIENILRKYFTKEYAGSDQKMSKMRLYRSLMTQLSSFVFSSAPNAKRRESIDSKLNKFFEKDDVDLKNKVLGRIKALYGRDLLKEIKNDDPVDLAAYKNKDLILDLKKIYAKIPQMYDYFAELVNPVYEIEDFLTNLSQEAASNKTPDSYTSYGENFYEITPNLKLVYKHEWNKKGKDYIDATFTFNRVKYNIRMSPDVNGTPIYKAILMKVESQLSLVKSFKDDFQKIKQKLDQIDTEINDKEFNSTAELKDFKELSFISEDLRKIFWDNITVNTEEFKKFLRERREVVDEELVEGNDNEKPLVVDQEEPEKDVTKKEVAKKEITKKEITTKTKATKTDVTKTAVTNTEVTAEDVPEKEMIYTEFDYDEVTKTSAATISEYLKKKELTAADLVLLIDNGKLEELLADAKTSEDLDKAELLLEKISAKELGSSRYDIMTKLEADLETAKAKIDQTEDVSLDVLDAKATLCHYTNASGKTADDVLISKAMTALADDLETNGGQFSKNALSNLAREDVLEFMSLKTKLPEVTVFVGLFKDVLEVNKTAYNADYYKKTDFEKVKTSLKELKDIIKK